MKKIGLILLDLDRLLTTVKIKGGGGHVARRIVKSWLKKNDIIWDIICGPLPKLTHPNIHKIISMKANQVFDIDGCIEEGNSIIAENNYDEVVSLESILPYGVSLLQSHSYPYRNNLHKNFFSRFLSTYFSKEKIEKQKKCFSDKTTKLIAMSEKIKKDYSENYNIPKHNIFVVYPGCEIKEPNFKKNKDNIFKFGIVSGTSSNKGAHRFLFALRSLINKDKNIRGYIINSNSKKATFIELLIKVLGLTDYVEIIDYKLDISDFYKDLDCIVVPSRHEAFALVALEAASYHVIPIVSNNTGFAELVDNGKNGFVYDINKSGIKNLTNAMQELVNIYRNNVVQFENIQEEAFCTAKKYSWETFCDKVFNIVTGD